MKTMKTKTFTRMIYTLLFIIPLFSSGQVLYYSDVFNGGVVGAGYSPNYDAGGTGTINLPFTGTVRKGYLIVGREGNAALTTRTLFRLRLTQRMISDSAFLVVTLVTQVAMRRRLK